MAKTVKIADEVYPNSPLVEVVFEIRFPGEPAIECHRDEFYERIRDAYPNLLVPQMKPESIPALEPYRFEKQDKHSGIMLAINRLSYYNRKYPGYKNFRKEAVFLFREFRKCFKVSKLNRAGWRYINIIPYTREGGNIPLGRFFNLRLVAPEIVPQQFENLSIVLMSTTDGGMITTKLESMMAADRSHEALLLDFDYAKEHDLTFGKLRRYMDESHRFSRALFEELITDDYRKYLRGEAV